jgi:hypothetical protein
MQLFQYFLSSFLTTAVMDTLPTPFAIEISGKPRAKISHSEATRTQAKVETGAEAAVFELKNSRLGCNGWMLGRNTTEDRSMLPKKVLWFKMSEDQEERIQPVAAEKEGDSYVLKFVGRCAAVNPLHASTHRILGWHLIEKDGNVLASMFNDDEPVDVVVKMK